MEKSLVIGPEPQWVKGETETSVLRIDCVCYIIVC